MKKHIWAFIRRGAMFAWGGPVILAIVWHALKKNGVIESITVNEAVLSIVSTTIMAFIAAGISIVYDIEILPKSFAGLIQMAVLYLDYLGFYLINGWIPLYAIGTFTLIFAAGFAILWFVIYISIKLKVSKMNQKLVEE